MTAARTSTRWWLIRHAPVPNPGGLIHGSGDPAADTSDWVTAAALSAILPIAAVWLTSPLRRTRQTARALRPGVDPLTEPALAEQDFGLWEGLSHDEVAARHPEEAARFWEAPARNAPPQGESFALVAERVAGALRRLTAAHAGHDLIAVVHGGAIRAALALALDLTPEAALRFRVDHWSLTRLDHHGTAMGAGGDAGEEAEAWSVGCVNHRPGTFSQTVR